MDNPTQISTGASEANANKVNGTANYTDLIGGELEKAKQMHARAKQEALSGKSFQKVLIELLYQIKPVDFRERAGLEDGDKISRKLYVVISIDEIISTAIANNWGLCTKDGFIYVFNGKYWQAVNAEDFKPFLADAAMRMGVPVLEAKYHQFKDELYKQFLSASNLPTPETKKAILINLLNGTFEITNDKQELRDQRRADFIKYQLPFEYDPDTMCPMFDKYLHRVVPDADCRKVLAEYLGYIFINTLKLEKSLILYGNGANGKSVFFEIVNAILGDENICSYSLQNLTKYDSYQRAELSNKLLNYASEINGKLEASIFKQLVSGEPVEARQIYGKPFVMRDYGKLMFNCNELPKEVEQTNAFFRRFIIIPFNQTIPEAEQDPELAKKIISSELSGVFNWILEGLRRVLVQKKFTQSVMVKDQIDAYRRESDSVAMFIDDEGYKSAVEDFVFLKALYSDYKTFCTDNGYRACAIRTMSERLRMLGFESKKSMHGVILYAKKIKFYFIVICIITVITHDAHDGYDEGKTNYFFSMTQRNQPYLEKYAGRKSRHECPACHDKYSFTYYLNGDTGQVIDKSVGRCDHESGCGYHYTPKEYRRDNPQQFPDFSDTIKNGWTLKNRATPDAINNGKVRARVNEKNTKVLQRVSQREAGRIPKQYLIQSLGYKSNFIAFLCSIFDRYTLESPTIERLMNDYYLGQAKNGSVIYWQLDTKKHIRTGKIMQYDPATGKRIKNANGAIDWVHAKLKRDKVLPDDFNLLQCLFGEHLLSKYPDKIIALVEAEKSALIGAGVYPEYLWLATGGRSQLSIDKLQMLRRRTIIMFPDTDTDGKTYALWCEKAKELEGMGYTVTVSDLLERMATDDDKEGGLDIADYLICQLGAATVEPEPAKVPDRPLNREEQALQRLGNLNPNIYTLIDALGLVSATTGERLRTHKR